VARALGLLRPAGSAATDGFTIEDPDLPVWLAGVSTLAEVSRCSFNR